MPKIETAVELALIMTDGDGFGFNCADNVSDVMQEIGFKHVLTPGALENQLQKSDKVIDLRVYKG